MTTIRISAPARVRGRARWNSRTIRRLSRDAHALLAIGLVLTSMTIALVGSQPDTGRLAVISLAFLVSQAAVAIVAPYLHPTRQQRVAIGVVRFVLAIVYVSVMSALLRTGDFRPAAALFIPVVALAAAQGTREAVLVGAAAIALYLVPVLSATSATLSIDAERAVALSGTAILLSIGTRRSISALTVTVRRLGTSLARDRRRSRQLAAVESVGRLLAARGPDAPALERIVAVLGEDLGYDFVSVYLGSASRMHLAAQRGYDLVIEDFDGTTGVLGRVMRTKQLAFVPDVTVDPDYRVASNSVHSEISAPMIVGDRIVGILNVEADGPAVLDRSDVETMALVAERLASALALARERERLAARADLFRRLTSFAAAVNGTLDPNRLNQAIVEEVGAILKADSVVLTVLDRNQSKYVMRALAPHIPAYLGMPVEPGDGLAGRAIRDRAMVVDDRFDPNTSSAVRASGGADILMPGVAVP
ncbi:MAG TPA: GAF domain-containing protein, partial [Candidatus Limnocylindrales bacterium]|nr:GAF domain-containing protein [Candidatus Limnocylindrales bacterium]